MIFFSSFLFKHRRWKTFNKKKEASKSSWAEKRCWKGHWTQNYGENFRFFRRWNMIRFNDAIVFTDNVHHTWKSGCGQQNNTNRYFSCLLSIVNVHVGAIWHMVGACLMLLPTLFFSRNFSLSLWVMKWIGCSYKFRGHLNLHWNVLHCSARTLILLRGISAIGFWSFYQCAMRL